MAFILRCIKQYMFGVKIFLVADRVLLMAYRLQQLILSVNLDDMLKNETLIWTFKLVKLVCETCVYFLVPFMQYAYVQQKSCE